MRQCGPSAGSASTQSRHKPPSVSGTQHSGQRRANSRRADDCLAAFANNHYFGLAVFTGLFVEWL